MTNLVNIAKLQADAIRRQKKREAAIKAASIKTVKMQEQINIATDAMEIKLAQLNEENALIVAFMEKYGQRLSINQFSVLLGVSPKRIAAICRKAGVAFLLPKEKTYDRLYIEDLIRDFPDKIKKLSEELDMTDARLRQIRAKMGNYQRTF